MFCIICERCKCSCLFAQKDVAADRGVCKVCAKVALVLEEAIEEADAAKKAKAGESVI